MKGFLRLAIVTGVLLVLAPGLSSVYAQCPEDTVDRGNCDTLTMICLDCEQTPGTGPWQVRFPLLITHDQTEPDDSIAGFVIPLGWTLTNPAKYCSLDAYWNATSTLWVYPDFARSIFRHILNESDPTDTIMHNRMAQIGGDFSNRDWDTRVVDVSTDGAYARMSIVATGTEDQGWWEGDRVLLATLTYVIEDTMTMCIDTTFWPPTGQLLWSRADAKTYVPRDNLPNCFTVGVPPEPDFTIEASPDTQTVEAGQSTDYTVTLTSIAGFNSPCTLTVTGLPAGASASFAPNPVTPTNTSNMNVTTTGATPVGTYTLTITGTELTKAQVQHSTQVVLKVTAPESVTVTAPNGGEEWCVGSTHSITWTSSSIDTVKIEYSTNGGSSWITEVEKTPAAPGTYSWTVPGSASTQCLVRICDARDGDPCDQSDAVFTIQAVPAAPSGCIASDDLCDKVSFSWTDNSSNESGFCIYRDGSVLDSVGANVVSYDDLTATPGMTYEYCVSAYNLCGESSQCCDEGTRRAPPAAPSDCMASDDLCDKVQFSWTDNSADETGFIIYRGGSALDTVGANITSYDDLTAAPGTTYEYCVSAYNDCGESSQCCDDGTRRAPPAAPSDCVASDDICDRVQFSWADNSGDEFGFYIYRDGSVFDSVGADVTSYDDFSGTPGSTYNYCVSAFNDCGESGQCCDEGVIATEAVTVTAPNGGEDWIVGSTQNITWNSTCMDSVKIEYSTDAGSNWITETEKVPAGPGSYSWTVPTTPSEDCLVRICDAADGTPCDQSDGLFTISCEGDFTIEAVQPRRKLLAGNAIDYDVELTSVDGFASPCTLTVTGLPADATADFDPNPVTPTGTSVMTISTSTTTPPGFYDLTITASEIGGCGIEHSTQVVLMVSVLETLTFTALHSAVDLMVTNPMTDSISLEFNTILDGTYQNILDENGEPADRVTISLPLLGEYQIRVLRGQDATHNDVFTLVAGVNDWPDVYLATNVPVPPGGQHALDYVFVCLPYVGGDANGDYVANIGDVVYLVNYLYKGGPSPIFEGSGDNNGDGVVDVGDVVYLINYLFRGGPSPLS